MAGVNLNEVTQSLIAILVVLGGGVMLLIQPDLKDVVLTLVSAVITYYFVNNSVKRGVEIGKQIPTSTEA